MIIQYYKKESSFRVGLLIAECLGNIVLQYIPEKLGKPTFSDSCVLYFAQEMLKMNTQMGNGAILRKFPEHVYEIPNEIVSSRGKYDISRQEKTDVEAKIQNIFPKYPNMEWGYGVLSSELDIMEEYIEKNSSQILGKQVQTYRIEFRPTDLLRNGSYAQTLFFTEAASIWHINPDNAKFDLSAFYKEYGHGGITPISLIRLAIAHELGHAILHQKDSVDGRHPYAEREASYFARLLLRRRELLHNNGNVNKKYKDACKQWDNLFRHVHRHDDKELINWVLADDEWLHLDEEE
jgi:hypothetical protein